MNASPDCMMLKLFSDRSHYHPERRSQLADILRPFWKTGEVDQARIEAEYGPVFRFFSMVDSPAAADLFVLPMSWNHYLETGQVSQARNFIELARRHDRKILTQTMGDFGVTPPVGDFYLLRCSGYRSRSGRLTFGQPVFIRDPLSEYYRTDRIFSHPKGERPVVGFCGQAQTTLLRAGFDLVRTAVRNTGYHLKVRPEEPQVLYPSTLRRSKALALLEVDPRVETNFVRRVSYRAGAITDEERWNTALEFYDNIRDSDYILCLRGGGNFSVRLYETLAMGRIPLFVDTDGLLPLDNVIDWKKHVVWVAEADLKRLPELLASFHHDIHPDDFRQMQFGNRQLWEEKLTFTGFFRELTKLLAGGGLAFSMGSY